VALPHPPLAIAFGTWALAAALYSIGFFQRVAPAVLTNELMTEFALGAAALGNLSALYFYAYGAMQIPTGVLVDHYGARRVIAIGAAVAALGALAFALAPTAALLGLGRFLVGAAVGVGFVATLKLASHWVPASRFALFSGLALVSGMLGGVAAGVPLRIAVDSFAWRPVMAASASITALVAIAAWLWVRDDPSARGYASYAAPIARETKQHSMAGGVLEALRYRNAWLALLGCGAISGPALAFGGLWGVPFLVQQYGMTTQQAAVVTSTLLIAWAAGGPLAGMLSDRVRRRKAPIVAGGVIASCLWALIVFVPALPYGVLMAAIVAIGLASSVVMIQFAFAKESTPTTIVGTVSGIVNMGNMLAGTLMQPLIGVLLDRAWHGEFSGGVRFYDLEAWQTGFALMVGWIIVGTLLLVFARETHCRQTV
jgi:sugar phosphate permease